MAAQEQIPDLAQMAEDVYRNAFSRRRFLQYSPGVLGAVLIKDQVEGSEALGLSPVMQIGRAHV